MPAFDNNVWNEWHEHITQPERKGYRTQKNVVNLNVYLFALSYYVLSNASFAYSFYSYCCIAQFGNILKI